MVVLYWPAMFAGGAVGAVGLLLPPLHAVVDPITTAIASQFILASKLGRNQRLAWDIYPATD